MGCSSSSPADEPAVDAKTKTPPTSQVGAKYTAPLATALVDPVQLAADAARKNALRSESSPGVPPPLATPSQQRKMSTPGESAQEAMLKVSQLMSRLAEVRSDKMTPVQMLRKALEAITADCGASFACVQAVSDGQDASLIVASMGSPQFLEAHRLQKLGPNSGLAVDAVLKCKAYMEWRKDAPGDHPKDWQTLLDNLTSLFQISAAPINVGEKCVGVLTLALDEDAVNAQSDVIVWKPYMSLVAASLSSLLKDGSIPKYMVLIREIRESTDLDTVMHQMTTHFRVVLGHTGSQHIWYRIALTSASGEVATIFDDLSQVPGGNVLQRGGGSGSSHSQSGTNQSTGSLIKDIMDKGGVIRSVVNMKNTIMKISIHNRQQVMVPDVQKLINQSGNVSVDIFNTRLVKPPTSVLVFPIKVKSHIFGAVFCMSGVQTDFADVAPRMREMCEVMSPHLLQGLLAGKLAGDYEVVQEATLETAATQHSGSISRNLLPDAYAIGGSYSGNHDGLTQSHVSSTGALVTGLTEKLNNKRIKSTMNVNAVNQLDDLQVVTLLGEGGFAKVFRGLRQGLVVAIKVVVDDGKSEKMVMKNAHEVAILTTLSHPHVTQAYLCLTDVLVRDFTSICFRAPTPDLAQNPAYQYLVSMEDKLCHVEVIEFCDLGNLASGLKRHVFFFEDPQKAVACLAEVAASGPDDSQEDDPKAASQHLKCKVNMRSLVLTLIEVGSALGYLHRMGVVHCDMKPANVLLKSSSNDPRGFTAKVSDFGLSRVQDDDVSSSFPFNSCGTAAYVAPDALISNKKVNNSVDVYAFGILMWEMYTSQRPYGDMPQQQLVEEVVMRNLRPKFPANSPGLFVQLAQACWHGSPHRRPAFPEILVALNAMLTAIDQNNMKALPELELIGINGEVEYANMT